MKPLLRIGLPRLISLPRGWCRPVPGPFSPKLAAVALVCLLAGTTASAQTRPFLLRCEVKGGGTEVVRVDPGRKVIEILDPRTFELRSRIRTEPPPKGAEGIVDDTTVRITPQQVSWTVSRYRPEYNRQTTGIDLRTLSYQHRSTIWMPQERDPLEEGEQGTCRRIEAPQPGFGTHSPARAR